MNDIVQLRKNAEEVGIAVSHYDIDGNLIFASPASLEYFTNLLQSKPHSNQLINRFDDVLVVKENTSFEYPLKNTSNISVSFKLYDEHNHCLFQEEKAISNGKITFSGLGYGYYHLELQVNQQIYKIKIIVSPKTAYQPSIFSHKKAWGLNIQLYSLRSERNWGIGDFADLDYLVRKSAPFGIDFIGINPLHLLYPAIAEWASPYSSSSRRWLNYLYLAIDTLPEFKLCKSVQNWFNQVHIQEKLAELRQQDTVNYEQVNRLKEQVLRELFAFFNRSKSAKIKTRKTAFENFIAEQGIGLKYQALFDVLDKQEHQQLPEDENQIGWLGWQKKLQELTTKQRDNLIKQYQDEISFYMWLQWLTSVQLDEIQTLCQNLGMQLGIYGDLAVSSSRGSADVWSDPELYCVKASVGAPPDPLGPVGQNWNIPPYNPEVLKARGFQPFIDLLRANMQYFGVLRIDHIMGLFRLWLIPEGKGAADGLYVHYPFEALMAILAIESQRNHCLIIGEDLGTVPDEVRSKLSELSIFSYFVLYFEQGNNEYPKVEHFPLNAFATVGTHDVPSLASFWHCRDLELFGGLNILQGDILKQKYDQRVIDKQALLNTLHRDNYLPNDYWGDALTMAMHDNLNQVIHQYLAESQTKLIGVQLENLLEQEVVFNLPGTSTEYPNWRKKLCRTLEDALNDEHIISFFNRINQARQK
ncbi:4-alpha-glucanotransferase [Bisgaardia hudsonensis]|uniref:4-alpha-glucanotransferase n=1 Tax=Bisgaardia hudsonensis TaxID=109472 RepID=A0A4R2N1F2_9PAST|nr:4-alpha-glucanotransferase [Bisgaardia hudsonensis]QLB13077.1 4-alpha-glucanotransferase [Bisgaardia hudsonensis]TCP13356.1 4-alpha-glucanotransferase [Bisgaardia hudsonensis]